MSRLDFFSMQQFSILRITRKYLNLRRIIRSYSRDSDSYYDDDDDLDDRDEKERRGKYRTRHVEKRTAKKPGKGLENNQVLGSGTEKVRIKVSRKETEKIPGKKPGLGKHASTVVSGSWETVIGLEIHAQIIGETKMFSGASTSFQTTVNRNVSLFDAALPGTLPVLNKRCVEAGVMTALALNCRINPVCRFDRKHYFYPDLPAGFQITQQFTPLAYDGFLECHLFKPGAMAKVEKVRSRIKQLQLEQDSGKSIYDGRESHIDLNRAGTPLMELVFDPDLRSADQAVALLKELILILTRLQTCTCKMEKGALRVDVNISVRKPGQPLGVRTEIKNIGSMRGVAGAINYERDRQISILEKGEKVINETRGWDAASKTTVSMRDKEDKMDYRYMPEPNLPLLFVSLGPANLGCVDADALKRKMPELPEQTRTSLEDTYYLSPEQAVILVNENALLNLFMQAVERNKIDTKLLANLLIHDLLNQVNKRNLELEQVNIPVDNFVEIVDILGRGMINRNTAKMIISEMLEGNMKKPIEIVKERDWEQISDEEKLRDICRKILDENEKAVTQYKAGKEKAFKALLGSVAAKTNKRANMEKCTTIMKELLDKP